MNIALSPELCNLVEFLALTFIPCLAWPLYCCVQACKLEREVTKEKEEEL